MRVVALKAAGWTAVLAGVALVASAATWPKSPAPTPLHTLVIGGGPDQEHNQVAIESNVRYLARLLPTQSSMRVLFADGNPSTEDVQCEGDDSKVYYRAPKLPRLDGPAKSANVKAEIERIAADLKKTPSAPVLLYFTGHGSPDRPSQYNNNRFDLWDGDDFSVVDLARSVKALPTSAPITIVMVQCFSGAFGNILFQNGDPTQSMIDQHVCGFFAAVPQRMAAGCTPHIKEADYKDFSGYFFAALSGTDRTGSAVVGADYNHDGRVGMNEAFAYSLLHDESIDTPVCTSDTFLRKYVTTPDPEVFQASYSKVRAWATPAQLAALDGLSELLGMASDDRLAKAYEEFLRTDASSEDLRDVRLIRFVRLAKSIILGHTLKTSKEQNVKARYATLVAQEAKNPLRPTT